MYTENEREIGTYANDIIEEKLKLMYLLNAHAFVPHPQLAREKDTVDAFISELGPDTLTKSSVVGHGPLRDLWFLRCVCVRACLCVCVFIC